MCYNILHLKQQDCGPWRLTKDSLHELDPNFLVLRILGSEETPCLEDPFPAYIIPAADKGRVVVEETWQLL